MFGKPKQISNEWTFIKEGLEYEQYEFLAKAAAKFAKALKINPDNVTALIHKADVLYRMRRYDESLKSYSGAMALDPKNIDALFGKGQVLEKMQQYDKALKCFDDILDIDDTYTDAIAYAALCKSGLGDHAGALDQINGVLAKNFDHVQAHYCKSHILARLGKESESIMSLNHAHDAESKLSDLLFKQGQDYAAKKKYKKAVDMYNKALHYNPENTDALVSKGWTLDFVGLPTKDVLPLFDKAIKIDPQCTGAHLNMGFVFDRTGMHRKAVDCFDHVLEYDSKNVRALYSKGVALYSLKEYSAAVFFCDSAIRLAPSNKMAICCMVWILEHKKKYNDALRYCDMALEVDPNYVYAISYRGKILYQLKQYAESLKCYQKALALDPNNQTAEYYSNKVLKIIEKENRLKRRGQKHRSSNDDDYDDDDDNRHNKNSPPFEL